MNQFSERYKSFSNSDLFRVIGNQSDYQAEAIEAAESEINSRSLSDREIREAKWDLESEEKEKQKQNEKRAKVERKVRTLSTSVFDTIKPFQESPPTTVRQIKLITFVFGLNALFKWYNQFGLVEFMLIDNSAEWGLSLMEPFLPMILLPLALILFWLRKRSGWVLITAYLTYSTMLAIGQAIVIWRMGPFSEPVLDSLIPRIVPSGQILIAMFFGGLLWLLRKGEIREHYSVSKQSSMATIGIAAVLTILFIAALLWT